MRCEARAPSAPTGMATQHEVGAAPRAPASARRLVDDAELRARARGSRGVAADADDLRAPRPRALQRERERAADQADADDDERARSRGTSQRSGLSAAASAARKRSFSLGQADGHAQVIGHAVAGDRPHDHALRAAGAGRPCPPAPHRPRGISTVTKLPYDGMHCEARAARSRRSSCAMPGRVERVALVARTPRRRARRRAAASARLFTLNGWRTRFSRSATSRVRRARSRRAGRRARRPWRTCA